MSYKEWLIEKINNIFEEHTNLKISYSYILYGIETRPLSSLENVVEEMEDKIIKETDEYKLADYKISLYNKIFPKYCKWIYNGSTQIDMPPFALIKACNDIEEKISQKKGLSNFGTSYFELVKNSTLEDY